jgi:hypothetical protein
MKKIPVFYGTPEVHDRVHKSPSIVNILSHMNPVHIPTFYLFKMNFGISID